MRTKFNVSLQTADNIYNMCCRGHGSEVYDIAWSPNASYIIAGTMDNTAFVWDTKSCRKRAMLQHHKGYVQGVAWDPANKLVTTVSSDRWAFYVRSQARNWTVYIKLPECS